MKPVNTELLRSQFRGALIGPEDAEYDAARSVYNSARRKIRICSGRCVVVAEILGW